MGNPYVSEAGGWLVSTLFDLYILLIMLRFLFQLVRADFYNPISQFLVRATAPVLRPARRLIPGFAGIDLAALVLMVVLKMVEWWLVLPIRGVSPSLGAVFFIGISDLLSMAINVFLVSILVQVILSWVNPGSYHPVTALLYRLNEPLLKPARRLLPSIGGLDLSPVLVLILLQFASMLLVAPIRDLGRGLLG